jgi:hypothetical protein
MEHSWFGSDKNLMVMDVESIGLHGQGFCVAWAVVNPHSGELLEEGYIGCPSFKALGTDEGREWVFHNVDPHLPPPNADSVEEVCNRFWDVWMKWRGSTELYAQCGWPVEARFLIACVDLDLANRGWKGPFPLRDIADYTDAVAREVESGRLPNELPAHNPINDVRRSARILMNARKLLKTLWAIHD